MVASMLRCHDHPCLNLQRIFDQTSKNEKEYFIYRGAANGVRLC